MRKRSVSISTAWMIVSDVLMVHHLCIVFSWSWTSSVRTTLQIPQKPWKESGFVKGKVLSVDAWKWKTFNRNKVNFKTESQTYPFSMASALQNHLKWNWTNANLCGVSGNSHILCSVAQCITSRFRLVSYHKGRAPPAVTSSDNRHVITWQGGGQLCVCVHNDDTYMTPECRRARPKKCRTYWNWRCDASKPIFFSVCKETYLKWTSPAKLLAIVSVLSLRCKCTVNDGSKNLWPVTFILLTIDDPSIALSWWAKFFAAFSSS